MKYFYGVTQWSVGRWPSLKQKMSSGANNNNAPLCTPHATLLGIPSDVPKKARLFFLSSNCLAGMVPRSLGLAKVLERVSRELDCKGIVE